MTRHSIQLQGMSMMSRVFRSTRSKVLHIVHETDSAHGVMTALCGAVPAQTAFKNEKATCDKCCALDNPFEYVAEVFIDDGRLWGSTATRSRLRRADYVTSAGDTTPRGNVLLDDFRIGAAPVSDEHGVIHARYILSKRPHCNSNVALFSDRDRMSTERYAKIRLVADALNVTCIACVAQPPDAHLMLWYEKMKELVCKDEST
jgi:hypothetical protein